MPRIFWASNTDRQFFFAKNVGQRIKPFFMLRLIQVFDLLTQCQLFPPNLFRKAKKSHPSRRPPKVSEMISIFILLSFPFLRPSRWERNPAEFAESVPYSLGFSLLETGINGRIRLLYLKIYDLVGSCETSFFIPWPPCDGGKSRNISISYGGKIVLLRSRGSYEIGQLHKLIN